MAAITRHTLDLAWKSWIGNDLEPHGPGWLQWVITGLFCGVIALCFTVLGFALNAFDGGRAWTRPDLWLQWFGKNYVVSGTIGYLIHGMFALLIPAIGKTRIRGWSDEQRSVFFGAVPIIGVIVGWPLGVALMAGGAPQWMREIGAGTVVGIVLISLLINFIVYQVFSAKQREVLAERRAVEAQLRLLQAQMEPHFLFNTLAGVQTMIDIEPERAKRQLESFTDYLRASIDSLRTEDSMLGRELDLARTYLELMQQRMEDRLGFTIEADPSLASRPLPPLLLQPLVENAIHHGLEPKIEGGHVRISAREDGGALVIEVRDDGLGPDGPRRPGGIRGNGIALDNIRRRLEGRWGVRATLDIAAADPGTLARLRLPLETPAR